MRVGTDEVREQSKGSGALTEDKGAGPKTRVLRPHARSTFDAKDTVEMDLAIEVEGVSKRFGAKKALDDVSLRVGTGKVLALLGPNGAGKTTLVRVLTTLLLPDSGRARVAGFDVERDAKTIRSMIGLAGQYATVDEMLTGRENLELVGLLYHLSKGTYRRRAKEALERMTLTEAGDKPVKTYSGGMKRRLDLAASLIGRPPVLFLDEPTTGLDPQGRIEVWHTVKELAGQGTTVLLTTQHLDEAEQLADRIAILHEGRIIANGTLAELKQLLPPAKVEYVEKQPTLEDVFLAIVGATSQDADAGDRNVGTN
jgi:ABC-2 type transport system ATP-binding protein